MRADQRPNLEVEFARLKDFQRRTVDYVDARLWDVEAPARRFLVADEVGLGKTMVARGVIAKAIDRMWDTESRIDIVYICSNQQIARQNLNRLNIGGYSVDHADRLTMLPRTLHNLRKNKVNFVSFTPGTSFAVGESGGRWDERVLLQRLVAKALGRQVLQQVGWLRFFCCGAKYENFEASVRAAEHHSLDETVAQQFLAALNAAEYEGRPLLDVIEEQKSLFSYQPRVPWDVRRKRNALIGYMRKLLAQAAVAALKPSLIVFDEFQRFKDLLNGDSGAGEVMGNLIGAEKSRVLLLSATPYRMYTLPDEPEGDNHYRDFLDTVSFLAGPAEAKSIAGELSEMHQIALQDGDTSSGDRVARGVEERLRRVMCRTERLAATPNRDGMLTECDQQSALPTVADIKALRTASRLARAVGGQDMFEYWRSAPYAVNLMDNYKVKEKLRTAIDTTPTPELLAALTSAEGLLSANDIRRYREIDPGNAKLRALADDVLSNNAERIAWLPPSLPYYTPSGPFAAADAARMTKRLVFSAWSVVPKAIATMLSYEAERRSSAEARGNGRHHYEQTLTAPLRFQEKDGKTTGMPVLAMLYPSLTLAEVGDPLKLAREVGDAFPADRNAVRSLLRKRIAELLEELPPGNDTVLPDESWYWAAPFALDAVRHQRAQEEFHHAMTRWGSHAIDDDNVSKTLPDHVTQAFGTNMETLGHRPDDLADVLVDMALAGPGVCALRALVRVGGEDAKLADTWVRNDAWRVAWAMRSLFNRPVMISFIRTEDEPYWRRVLRHCEDGNLQAVLDEYAHVLVESEGLQESPPEERTEVLANVMAQAASIRTVTAASDDVIVDGADVRLERIRVRSHFAMRFGQEETEARVVQREGEVRVAFNSPFWPFVLASTSVGQEGLDFHTYCHAVMHWNLPGNPVDLEQREGRVHRYKGHAVRRNVAARCADAAWHATVDDPWFAMFLAAEGQRPQDESEIYPYWVYPGAAQIERHVALAPLSTETARYRQLKKSVGLYRLAIGQARQEDLVALAAGGQDLSWMQLNLAPR